MTKPKPQNSPPWLTDLVYQEAAVEQEDILRRVEQFQDDITQEAEIKLRRKFPTLTDDQVIEVFQVWV